MTLRSVSGFSSKMAGWRSLIHQSSCTIYLLHLLRFCRSTTYRFTTTETGRPRSFAFWCPFVVTLGGLDPVRGRSAFIGIRSEIDQSRFRFAYFTRGQREGTNKPARALGRNSDSSSDRPARISAKVHSEHRTYCLEDNEYRHNRDRPISEIRQCQQKLE